MSTLNSLVARELTAERIRAAQQRPTTPLVIRTTADLERERVRASLLLLSATQRSSD